MMGVPRPVRWGAALLLHVAFAASAASTLDAQTGTGTTGAAVLQLPGGGRAAGMGGAYVAGADGDVLFYNPAGAAWLRGAGGLSYQRHVDEIGFGTASAAVDVGPVVMLSFGFLDYGSIAEVVPDPLFGGQRGEETGQTADAMEIIGKAGVALRLPGGRATVGGSVGVLWVSLAETGRTATLFDFGGQYRLTPMLTFGAALRNAGGDLEGARLDPAPLPSEFRAGLSFQPPQFARNVALTIHVDGVAPLNGGSSALAAGAEAAVPLIAPDVAVSARAGYNGTVGGSGLGRFHLGAGLERGRFALDYAFQNMDLLGSVHRFGVRWSH